MSDLLVATDRPTEHFGQLLKFWLRRHFRPRTMFWLNRELNIIAIPLFSPAATYGVEEEYLPTCLSLSAAQMEGASLTEH